MNHSLDVCTIPAVRRLAQQQNISMPLAVAQYLGCTTQAVAALLGQLFSYPLLSAAELQCAQPYFHFLSFQRCQQKVQVIQKKDEVLRFAITDPFDSPTILWAQRRIPHPHIYVADVEDIKQYLDWCEHEIRAMDAFATTGDPDIDRSPLIDLSLASVTEDQNAIIKLVNTVLYDALKIKASDIHVESTSYGMMIRYRMDGFLRTMSQINGIDTTEQTISRIKVLADLDTSERRVPQDGRFKARIHNQEVDFRVSIMPSIFGEDAVLRLLDRQSLIAGSHDLSLTPLGLAEDIVYHIRSLMQQPHGLFLVTGPTGSGKTTTLYAALSEIQSAEDKIITIEDPVEYRLPNVLQIPVNEKKGLTFAKGLRSILRHDPDKIMVGEIRDVETAHIAVQAALTGHLVFSTVHANSVFDVLGRFVHMGLDPYGFTTALNGIVGQRLARLNCPHCLTGSSPHHFQYPIPASLQDQLPAVVYTGKGCSHCHGAGYSGRQAIAELLVLDDQLRDRMIGRATLLELKKAAQHKGWLAMHNTVLQWLGTGKISLREAIRVTS